MNSNNELLPFNAIAKLSFRKRPKLISPDLRYFRRLSLIILILKYTSFKGQGSMLKLQFFNWAMASARNMKLSLEYINEPRTIKSNIISYDPSLQRAIEFALGDEFIGFIKTGTFKLSAKGEQFLQYLINDETVLVPEKEYLKIVSTKSISETQVESIVKGIY